MVAPAQCALGTCRSTTRLTQHRIARHRLPTYAQDTSTLKTAGWITVLQHRDWKWATPVQPGNQLLRRILGTFLRVAGVWRDPVLAVAHRQNHTQLFSDKDSLGTKPWCPSLLQRHADGKGRNRRPSLRHPVRYRLGEYP